MNSCDDCGHTCNGCVDYSLVWFLYLCIPCHWARVERSHQLVSRTH